MRLKVTNKLVAQIVENAIGHMRRREGRGTIGHSEHSCDALLDALCLSTEFAGVKQRGRNLVKTAIINQATDAEALEHSFDSFDEFDRGDDRQQARALWLTFVAEGFERGEFSVDEINNILREA
jgi:hypothetical protein